MVKEPSTKQQLKTLDDKVTNLSNLFISLSNHVCRLEEQLDTIISTYPKLYDNVDKLVAEIIENRQERIFLTRVFQKHEHRINALERYKLPSKKVS